MIFDVNAWVGNWPYRSLRDNTPEALVARLDRSGIGMAAVSLAEAILHRNVQPANEKLIEVIQPFEAPYLLDFRRRGHGAYVNGVDLHSEAMRPAGNPHPDVSQGQDAHGPPA